MDEMTDTSFRNKNMMDYECDVDYTKVQNENVMKYEWY